MLDSLPMDGALEKMRSRLLAALEEHGREAVSFQAIEDGVEVFEDPLGVVAYVDTGSAWLAIGSPLTDIASIPELSARFVAAARARRRRVSFVAVESLEPFANHRSVLLGEQPIYPAASWESQLRSKKSLREQLRRARAKGVQIRRVSKEELQTGSALRKRVRELAEAWLATRRMEPLQFLVALEPFHEPDEHRYYVAEKEGVVLAFASAIPIPARRGFLIEDILRADDAPNGTTELLFDAAIRDEEGAEFITLGLSPLSGEVSPVLAVARDLTRPLYDFVGLRAFKERLLPSHWESVFLVLPKGEYTLPHLVEVLRAFAGGSLFRFGALSIVRHESGPPWLLVAPLVLWIALRIVVASMGGAAYFGSDAATVVLWSLLDVVLAASLFRAALRPRARGLALATGVAALVAIRSAYHIHEVGFGTSGLDIALRIVLLVAPIIGACLLALSTLQRKRYEQGKRRRFELTHF